MRGNTSAWADPRSTGRCYASLVPPNGMSHQRLPESPSACASGFPGLQISSPVAPRSCPHSGAAPGVQSRTPPKGHGRYRTIAEQSMQHARKAKTYLNHGPRYPRVSSPMGEDYARQPPSKREGPAGVATVWSTPYSQIIPWVSPWVSAAGDRLLPFLWNPP